MRSTGLCLLSVSLATLPLVLSHEDPMGSGGESQIVTLYAHDDLQSSFDFRLGGAGGRVQDGEARLTSAQIAFDVFAPGQLSFGFVRDEFVELLDLGDMIVPPHVSARDRAAEFPITLFHTLFFDGVRFAYVGPGGQMRPFDPADRILGPFPPEELRHLEPRVGHTYLLRVRRSGIGMVDEFFKFQVVDLLPDHSLTIRWATASAR